MTSLATISEEVACAATKRNGEVIARLLDGLTYNGNCRHCRDRFFRIVYWQVAKNIDKRYHGEIYWNSVLCIDEAPIIDQLADSRNGLRSQMKAFKQTIQDSFCVCNGREFKSLKKSFQTTCDRLFWNCIITEKAGRS